MKTGKAIELLRRFTTDDMDKPGLERPWRTDGMAYATDGRIAICLHDAPKCGDWAAETREQAGYARRIRRWVLEDEKALVEGRRRWVPLDFAKLAAAADAALADAGDGRNAAIILPDGRHTVIGARYARLVADAYATLGECACVCWAKGRAKRGLDGYRILFTGDSYDTLLMAIATEGAMAHGVSVADAATGALVKRIDDAAVAWGDLRRGKQ